MKKCVCIRKVAVAIDVAVGENRFGDGSFDWEVLDVERKAKGVAGKKSR